MAGSAYGPLTAVTLPARPVMEKHKDQAAILADASITYTKYSGGELFQTRDLAVLELADEGAPDPHFTAEGAGGGKYYEAGPNFSTWARFAEAVARGRTWPPGTVHRVGAFSYVSSPGADVIDGLPGILPLEPYNFLQFGTAGDYRHDADLGTDDVVRMQAAVDWLGGIGGGTIRVTSRHRIGAPLVMDGRAVRITGIPIERLGGDNVSINAMGVIAADFTDGPMIWAQNDCDVIDLTVMGTSARRAAPITTGAGNVNSGILVEPPDVDGATVKKVLLRNVRIVGQPADGVSSEGLVEWLDMEDVYTNDTGRHGRAITDGQLSGRTHKGLPGIFNIDGGKSFDCGGHGSLVGHPDSGAVQPYRVKFENYEGYRCLLDPSKQLAAASNYVVGQNVMVLTSATGGTDLNNAPHHPCWALGGRDVNMMNCRFISAQDYYVRILQVPGFSTQGIRIIGGKAVSAEAAIKPAYFAEIPAGPDKIEIRLDDHDCQNPITAIPVSDTNQKVVLHSMDTIKYNNMTLDVSDAKMLSASKTLDIASDGAVTVDGPGLYYIDTENDDATDDLVTIHGGVPGMRITLRQSNSGRTVTLARTGNIRPHGAADYPFPGSSTFVDLIFDEQDGRWKSPSPPATV